MTSNFLLHLRNPFGSTFKSVPISSPRLESALKHHDWYLTWVLFNDDITTLVAYPPANVMTTYTVPASVTTIAAYAFSGMNVLQSLMFQNGLATINYYSISNSSSLQTVYIPLSVTNVVYSAIFNCTNLTIRVAASEKPVGWDNNWNTSSRPVIWGYID